MNFSSFFFMGSTVDARLHCLFSSYPNSALTWLEVGLIMPGGEATEDFLLFEFLDDPSDPFCHLTGLCLLPCSV